MNKYTIDAQHPAGMYTEMTAEEIAEMQTDAARTPLPEQISEQSGNGALDMFFTGLSSAETNSIAKIRALAKDFLTATGEL